MDRGQLNLSRTAARSTSGIALRTQGRQQRLTTSAISVEGGNTGISNAAATVPGNNVQLINAWVTCSGGAGSYGVSAQEGTGDYVPNVGGVRLSTIRLTSCETAVSSTDGSFFNVFDAAVVTSTTAFEVLRGGRMSFLASVPTFTTVTNETARDGATYSTFAALQAANALTNDYNSTLIE
jgi:hypothetical protein